jgi:hypothetical protein
MAKSTDATPSGFNQVPPHLEARNFLQHIDKFTNNRRAQNTHAKSKSRHKFRKLCHNVKTWKSNPDAYLKNMKTAWYDWNIAGIKEISDQPGTYLFMRAILTDSEDSESETSAVMIPSQVSHQSSPKMTTITDELTVGNQITVGKPLTDKSDLSEPEVPAKQNPFFSLATDNQSPRTWAQRARKANDTAANNTAPDSVIAGSDTQIDAQSINLLETSSIEIEPKPTASEQPEKFIALQQEITELRSLIKELQSWQNQTTTRLATATHDATMAKEMLEETDIVELKNNIRLFKENTVTQEVFLELKNTSITQETYDRNCTEFEQQTQVTLQATEQLTNRFTILETEDWISRTEYRQAQLRLHTELDTLTDTVTKHNEEYKTAFVTNALRPTITGDTTVQAIEAKHEEVTEALDSLYESIKEDLLTETKEYLTAELDFEMRNDSNIQHRIATITKDVFAQNKLETALNALLNEKLETAMSEKIAITMTNVMNDQINDFKQDTKKQLEQQLLKILEPSEHTRNPYNPVDRALKHIKTKIQLMVEDAINDIDTIIQGTVDQAVEDVRLSTRHAPRSDANHQDTRPQRTATQNPYSNPQAIPPVTPEKTFRGRTVRIDEPPPRIDDRYEYDRSRARARGSYDEYDRTRDDQYRSQRDQESFLKGHVEASLESLQEDDMIVWYKSFESYCSLHNIPLLTFHQVTKGMDLYPSTQPASERPRFSRIISLKLNQLHLIKDPTAKSIKNARVGRDDGYGALYALLAATIPRLQVNKIAPKTGSNKPPEWDPSTMNLYHYESKIQDYVEFQANKGRVYDEREQSLFFLEGLSTDESQRFKTALTTIMDKLDKIQETQPLPMDYRLGQIAQTVAELAQSDSDVGQDALTILDTATVRTANGKGEDPTIHYSRDGRQDNRTDDRRYDHKNNRRPGGQQTSRRPRRPKMEVQCHSCKLWGHEETHCDHLAKTIFAIEYAKKHSDKAEKVCEAFNKKNSRETQTIIKTLKALPHRRLPDNPTALPPAKEEYYSDEEEDDEYFEDILGSMLGGYGSSIRAAEAPDHNHTLLSCIDPLALETVRLPPFPEIDPPATDHTATVPIICQIRSHVTDAQADSGANRAITDNLDILHNIRQMLKPYPVGSIDVDTKLYCTAIGELRLCTQEGQIENFPCLYSAQSAGTVISPDNKCTTSPHLTQWEQVGDTISGTGVIRFRNRHEDIVATLPTYRRNGLWFTQLTAIPANEDTATTDGTKNDNENTPAIKSLYAMDDSMEMALTDSDRHYATPRSMGGLASVPTIFTTEQPTVETVEEEITMEEAQLDNAEELFPATTTLDQTHGAQDRTTTPYPDPHIKPPEEPPPPNKRKTVRTPKEPTAPHVDEGHIVNGTQQQRSQGPVKKPCRDWHGRSPPVPKQPVNKPTTGSQLQTELWHQRMAHPGAAKLKKTQQHTNGIPSLGAAHPLFGCNNCNMGKIEKQARGKTDSREAQANGERFHMDYGFFRGPKHLQRHIKRKYGKMTLAHPTNEKRKHKPIIESREGYVAYLLIIDGNSRKTWVYPTKTKEPPIQTVDLFLQRFGLRDGTQRYVRTDQGGELARSADFRAIIAKHGYVVEPTGPDASSQNGRGERPHRTLANMVRCMLYGANLGVEFWADALVYATYLYNRTYHEAIGKTPEETWTNIRPDLSHIRTFGSSVTVKKPGHRPTKGDPHCYHGIFLRFTATIKNLVYYDINTKRTKTATHKRMDEFHYGNPPEQRPKMATHMIDIAADDKTKTQDYGKPISLDEFTDLEDMPLQPAAAAAKLDDSNITDTDDSDQAIVTALYEPADGYHSSEVLNIEMSLDIFGPSTTEDLKIDPTHPTLGFEFHTPTPDARPNIKLCKSGTPAAKLKNWRSRFRHGTIRAINGEYMETIEDVRHTVALLKDSNKTACKITIAHHEIAQPLTASGIPQLHFDQLHTIAHHLHVLKYGEDYDLWEDKSSMPLVHEDTVHQAIADDQAVARFTRRQLRRREDWQVWKEAEWKQLTSYHTQDMFGEPIQRPSKATVLPFVWTYLFKDGIKPKARGTCNGGKRYGKAVTLAHTYASCVEQPGARVFWSLSALHGMTVLGADAGNAFAEAPPPVQPFYMAIDDQFRTWWTESMGNKPIPEGYVLPVNHALQGHPEAPRLWEKHIVKILDKLGFKSTTHEKCIYQKTVAGEKVLFLRQVDDFAVSCRDTEISKEIIRQVGAQLQVPLNDLGTLNKFNGLDILQTRDYVKIYCESFLDKVLKGHGWEETIEQHNPIPMRNDTAYQAQLESATLPSTPEEQKQLQDENFNYRQAIGEAIYAMTIARPDIAFAVIKLSQYSANPAKIHYQAVRHLFKFLALTKTRGIYYWRKIPVPSLPTIPAEGCVSHSEILDKIPKTKQPHRLHTYVDSDWGSDRTHRRSVTGLVIMMAGGVIAYKSKYQPTIALSSTEAEFTAAAEAGKTTLYLRSILHELGFSQYLPTVLYEDNTGALHMANAQQPTRRTRHMDTKHFAIQDWVEHDQLDVTQIGTALNISDAFTKALGRIKFYEQTDVIMGRRIPPYVPSWVLQDHPAPTKTFSIPSLSSSSKPRLLSALEAIHDLLPTSFFNRISSTVRSMGG